MSMHSTIMRYIRTSPETENTNYALVHQTDFAFWAEFHYADIVKARKGVPKYWKKSCDMPSSRKLFVDWAFDYLVNEYRREKEDLNYKALPAIQFVENPPLIWSRVNNARKPPP